MMVAINGAVSVDILDTAPGQPQLVTVPWIEVDDTPVSVIAYPGDPVFNS